MISRTNLYGAQITLKIKSLNLDLSFVRKEKIKASKLTMLTTPCNLKSCITVCYYFDSFAHIQYVCFVSLWYVLM